MIPGFMTHVNTWGLHVKLSERLYRVESKNSVLQTRHDVLPVKSLSPGTGSVLLPRPSIRAVIRHGRRIHRSKPSNSLPIPSQLLYNRMTNKFRRCPCNEIFY